MRVYRDVSAPAHLRSEAELRERIGLVARNICQFSGVYRFPNFETPFEIELAASPLLRVPADRSSRS